jgi:hypothetical protein
LGVFSSAMSLRSIAATVKKSHALRLLTLRLSTLFHFIVAEEHDKSVVPP